LGAYWILLRCGLLGSKHGYYDPFNIVENTKGIAKMLKKFFSVESSYLAAA
jgi:hypothetical protein